MPPEEGVGARRRGIGGGGGNGARELEGKGLREGISDLKVIVRGDHCGGVGKGGPVIQLRKGK